MDVLAGAAQVVATLPGPGRVELRTLRPAGGGAPVLTIEAYDATALVAGGEVAVWEVNQAIAALLAQATQARRLSLRHPGHGGHLDVVADSGSVSLVATARDRSRQVSFETEAATFAADLNVLVRHYLALSRGASGRTLVLPGVSPAPARR